VNSYSARAIAIDTDPLDEVAVTPPNESPSSPTVVNLSFVNYWLISIVEAAAKEMSPNLKQEDEMSVRIFELIDWSKSIVDEDVINAIDPTCIPWVSIASKVFNSIVYVKVFEVKDANEISLISIPEPDMLLKLLLFKDNVLVDEPCDTKE
jgi:hypothetical protein